jgi:beta-glucosidase
MVKDIHILDKNHQKISPKNFLHRSHPEHDHQCLLFPPHFLWGAATSAYQVEGGNVNADWWSFEQKLPEEKRSGDGAKHYELFELDFNLAKDLNLNAQRLSLEWSRIEPKEGEFDYHEIDHYKNVLKSLKDRQMSVMLTLWHFTLPDWVAKKGGWENPGTVKLYEKFIKRVVPELKDDVDLWITLNEPGVYVFQSYILGLWPPQKKSKIATIKAYLNMSKAHKIAYEYIHSEVVNAKVGISNNVSTYQALHQHSIREAGAQYFLDVTNHLFYKLTGKTHDFLGLNYYFNQYISFNSRKILPSVVDISTTKKAVSDMGWEIYPQGMFDILMDFSDYHLPIYITENGIASRNDDRRVRFLISYLQEIYHAISAGAPVKGYFYWSLIDNFEWADGFEPRFGLIEVDYKTQKRTVRPSAFVYQEIIKTNALCHDLLTLLGHGINVKDVLDTKKSEEQIQKEMVDQL